MSKIEELIQEYCPDGVEYKKIFEIASIERGKRVVRNELDESKGFPVYQNALIPLGYSNQYNRAANQPIVIAAGAAGDIAFINKEFWAADDCYTFSLRHNIDPKYLYQCLMNEQFYLKFKVRKGSVPRLSHKVISGLEIPVPPLPVQEEIVRILDTFTEMEESLNEELELRKKQYEAAINTLINACSDVQTFRLSDVVTAKTGSKPQEILASGEFEYINAGTTNSGYVSECNSSGDCVTTPSRGEGGIGFVDYQSNDFWCGPLCYKIYSKTEVLLNKYLYAYLQIHSDKILACKNTGGTPSLNRGDLLKIEIDIPSIEEQRNIITMLDVFFEYKNALGKEIVARHQQYEYYRDKLLTFKRKEV